MLCETGCNRKCSVGNKKGIFICLGPGKYKDYLLVVEPGLDSFGPQSVYVLNFKTGVPADCPVEQQRELVVIVARR